MATNSSKLVLSQFVDTWSRGPRILPYLTDLGPVKGAGDSVDVPHKAASTVNESESASPTLASEGATTLAVDRVKFVNEAISHKSASQLLNGDYLPAIVQPVLNSLINACERDVIEYLISHAASVNDHVNLAADALDSTDGPTLRARMVEQDGCRVEDCTILASPAAIASMSALAAYVEVAAPRQPGALGIDVVRSLAGVPVVEYSGVPGATNRYRVAVATSSITGNVLTVNLSTANHGFVVGQKVTTSGLAANVTTAAAIASVTGAAITIPLTSGDNATNGAGFLISGTSLALMVNRPWAFFASDSIGRTPFEDSVLMPDVTLVQRTDAAGMALKAVLHLGRIARSGAVKVLHAP